MKTFGLLTGAIIAVISTTAEGVGILVDGDDDGYHASTVGESHANGMATVMYARGQANLTNSEAALNMTEVRSREMDNRLQATNTYFANRQANSIARFGTPEEKSAHRAANQERLFRTGYTPPSKTPPSAQLDPLTGKITWPFTLMPDKYTEYREQLDKLFVQRAQKGGYIDYQMHMQIDNTTAAMIAVLKKDIRTMPSYEFINAQHFISSLGYVARNRG